jgi:hypothetical protein
LVPQLVIDSRRLRVLLSRGDARSDAELRRLVAAGRRALRRLVRDELDRGAALGRVGRAAMRLREALASQRRLGVSALGVLVLAAAAFLSSGVPEPERPDGLAGERRGLAIATGPEPGAVLAGDLAERYPGPVAETADRPPGGVALRYRPLRAAPMLGVFRVDSIDDRGRVVRPLQILAEGKYRGVECRAHCLEIELELAAGPGPVRLPVPTGHRLDPTSLSLGAGVPSVHAAADGGPVLVLENAFRGRLRYRTGPASELRPPSIGTWPVLPPEAAALAESLRPLDPEEVAARAADWVRGRVAYDASPATAERHRAAAAAGLGFAERCLAVGAGDCDVQATLAAAIVARAGVPVRLAVGWVGARGRALPGLHAWLEVLGRDGAWRAEDVSRGAGSPAIAAGSEPSAPAATRPRPLEPAPLTGDDGLGPGWTLPAALWLALAAAAVTAAGFAVAGRRRLRHRHRPSEVPDLAGLVRGALARPEAYSEVPALFERRIVPCLGDAPISLRRARRLAGRRALAVATRPGDLSRRAAGSGCGVVDGSRAEGRAAAAALGAVDLDRWQRLLAVGRRPPEARRIEGAAASVGERWRVLVSPEACDEVAVLDGLLSGREGPVVALSEGSAAWRSVAELAVGRPAAAALVLAETVLDALEWPSWRRRPILEALARDAVGEAAGVAS